MLQPQLEPIQTGTMVPEPYVVRDKRRDNDDTWTLGLAPVAGGELPFSPGQFTMISAGVTGEVPISISGDPDLPETVVHTIRAVGLATQALCAAEPGQAVSVRGPFGRPWPVEELEGADVVVAAGGVGLAPLRSAVLRLLARRERYGRLVLLLGGRTPQQLLYVPELEDWERRGMEVLVTVDSAGPEWLGHVGVVTRLVRRARLKGTWTAALCCGPEVMMRFMAGELQRHGVAPDQIHVSLERNMQCGIGHCGHCQLGPTLLCRDGPVYRFSELEPWLRIREL